MIRTAILSLVFTLSLLAQDRPPVPKPPVPKPAVPAPVQPAAQPAVPGQPARPVAPAAQPAVPIEPANQPAVPNQPADQPAVPNQPAAQPAVPNQPVPRIPGVQAPQPAVDPDPNAPLPPPVRAQIQGRPNPNQPTNLNVGNFTAQDVAELYNKYTGKLVLVSNEAAAGEISFFVPGEMNYGQAATIIEKKLVMEGYALVQDDDDPNLVKLVLANSVANGPKPEGPPLVDNLETLDGLDIPADGFVTYVMPLSYLKPDQALQAFQTVVGQYGSAGTVAAVPNAGSVVISGNLPLVRMLAKLKERIDVPSSQVATKFVEVTYGDVEDLADKLNEIFNNQRQSQQSARSQRINTPIAPPTPNAPPTPAAVAAVASGIEGAGTAGEETPINIIAQPRTSRIFLMGRPVDIIFVEGLIADFDAPSSKRNFLRLKLRYLPVTEFLDVAANAIERTLETGGTGAGGVGAAGARRSATSLRNTSSRTAINQTGATGNQLGGGFGQGASGAGRAQLTQQDIPTQPEPLLIGKTLLVADNISNSIVVNGPPHHIEIVEELVKQLDSPSEQVAISAVFGRYRLDKNRSFGLDVAQLLSGGRDFTGAYQNRNGVPSVIDPNTFINLPGGGPDLPNLLGAAGAGGAGLSAYFAIGDNFGAFVNALESNVNFTAISRPTVFTTNNGIARLSSGSRIAVPTSTFQGGATNGFSTNVEFRDIVLDLEVRPLVNGDDEVTLEISLVRDDIGGIRDIAGFGEVPDIDTDEISTRVTVPNRSTIVLGGLITESDNRNKSGIPFLSALPGIGPLFGSGRKDVKREELVILIHPSILKTNAEMNNYQRAYDSKSTVAPRARASVEGSGVLPERGEYAPNAAGNNPNAGTAAPVRESSARNPIMTSPTHRALRNKRRR